MFYTPFYLPFALGTYEAEGVDVTLSTSPSLDTVAQQLSDGIADVYWGGPMRIMVMRDKNREPEILGFSEAITRDPFFLIGKEPNPQFRPEGPVGYSLRQRVRSTDALDVPAGRFAARRN